MNSYELISAITAISIAIAQEYPDNNELNLLSSIFQQLGETLQTIASQRQMIEQRMQNNQDHG